MTDIDTSEFHSPAERAVGYCAGAVLSFIVTAAVMTAVVWITINAALALYGRPDRMTLLFALDRALWFALFVQVLGVCLDFYSWARS